MQSILRTLRSSTVVVVAVVVAAVNVESDAVEKRGEGKGTRSLSPGWRCEREA
jgi:hypothetical protein